MELFEAIAKRHSYRGPFRDEPVPREALVRIVQAGLRAPSGCNLQTTSFVIVDDPTPIRTIGAMPGAGTALQQARALIVCLIPTSPRDSARPMTFEVEDCAAAVENILLAVTALGYATVWLDGWLRSGGRAEAVGGLLGVPPDRTVRVLLPIGVPVKTVEQRERLPFASRAWFNHYGDK